MPEFAAWLILFLPLISFLLVAILVRPVKGPESQLAATVTIFSIGMALALSVWALISVVTNHGVISYPVHEWFVVGRFSFAIGIIMDPLTAIMLIAVTTVSLLVQIYSIGYMHGDSSYTRYYAYMSLFTMAMIGLVLANNLIQMFVFWELVGLGSYLLIGFWFHRPSAAAAAKKAFIITRVADFGLLIGILYLFMNSGNISGSGLDPFVISDLYKAVEAGLLGSDLAQWVALGIFVGAMGKSAQFPFHTWLPDAMEGPTPVSALIHAATMVAAGVFLVARFFPIFEASDVALNTVAIIGGITAVFAATMGLVSNDIKRVLAYSTVSQLGYMMLALGIGAYGPAIFHLFTHAFFKALLFLGSGSVNHATGTFDMRYMGGLRKVMPWTYATFFIGSLSLAGVFPLSGFWSKDEILSHALSGGSNISTIVFWLALVAVFMTAFYMFRALFMTFGGEFRGGAASDPDEQSHLGEVHLMESPSSMVLPLLVLSVPAIAVGFLANSVIDLGIVPAHWLSHFLDSNSAVHVESGQFNVVLAIVSTLIAVAGIGLAYLMYQANVISPENVGSKVKPLYTLLYRKYFMDELYEDFIIRRIFNRYICRLFDLIDRFFVDGIARFVGWLGLHIGVIPQQVQTGQLQVYSGVVFVGTVLILGILLVFR